MTSDANGGILAAIPKAELHLHIEGTLEPEMVFGLAERNRVPLPFQRVEELRARFDFRDLQSFLDVYYLCCDVLRTEEDFADLALAYLERSSAQGVRRAEIFFDPQTHTSRGVPMQTVVEGLWTGLETGRERFGTSAALIACFLRDKGPAAAASVLEEILPYRERILGVGLDSAEVGHPPVLFREVFDRARAEGLHCVAHAGEEGPPAYIWEALDLLGVERVDHGVRCMEDPRLVTRLRDEQVPLTVCPLSNVRLRVVDRMESHVLPSMMDAGLLVTVNSDDPAYFGGYAGDNFVAVAGGLGLDIDRLAELARNSFRAAFIAERERADYLEEVDRYLAAYTLNKS